MVSKDFAKAGRCNAVCALLGRNGVGRRYNRERDIGAHREGNFLLPAGENPQLPVPAMRGAAQGQRGFMEN